MTSTETETEVSLPLSEPEDTPEVSLPLSEPEDVPLPLSDPVDYTPALPLPAPIVDLCADCVAPDILGYEDVDDFENDQPPKLVTIPEQAVLVNVLPVDLHAQASKDPIDVTVPSSSVVIQPASAKLELSYNEEVIAKTVELPTFSVSHSGVGITVDEAPSHTPELEAHSVHVDYSAPNVSIYNELTTAPSLEVPLKPIFVSVPPPALYAEGPEEDVYYNAPVRQITVSGSEPTIKVADSKPVTKVVPARPITITLKEPEVSVQDIDEYDVTPPDHEVYIEAPEPKITIDEQPEDPERTIQLPPIRVTVPQQEIYVQIPDGANSFDVTPQSVNVFVPDYPVSAIPPEDVVVEVPASKAYVTVEEPTISLSVPPFDAVSIPQIPVHVGQPEINFHIGEAQFSSVTIPQSNVKINILKPSFEYIEPDEPVIVKVIHGFPTTLCHELDEYDAFTFLECDETFSAESAMDQVAVDWQSGSDALADLGDMITEESADHSWDAAPSALDLYLGSDDHNAELSLLI
eukprot:CAMPEP_0196659724 /NCGR_PEP_ID=MMETSP1086-20130531/36389_1 /TAXON_ID=77921 /ORGANISM="Cyanoptyche  gloeocystis , Strain SAG4.97" /LENGTH=518 /DNA_ID=CAMNT_0041993811 /DNA_START=64 /DNA_END=1620 /DNA_ORIENTATION=-